MYQKQFLRVQWYPLYTTNDLLWDSPKFYCPCWPLLHLLFLVVAPYLCIRPPTTIIKNVALSDKFHLNYLKSLNTVHQKPISLFRSTWFMPSILVVLNLYSLSKPIDWLFFTQNDWTCTLHCRYLPAFYSLSLCCNVNPRLRWTTNRQPLQHPLNFLPPMLPPSPTKKYLAGNLLKPSS